MPEALHGDFNRVSRAEVLALMVAAVPAASSADPYEGDDRAARIAHLTGNTGKSGRPRQRGASRMNPNLQDAYGRDGTHWRTQRP
jgi:hypothetical protein